MPHGDLARRMPTDVSELPSSLSHEPGGDSSHVEQLTTNTESLRQAGREVIDVRQEEEIQEFLAKDPAVIAAVKKFDRIYQEEDRIQDAYYFETDPAKKALIKEKWEAMVGTEDVGGLIELAERDVRLAEENSRQIFLLQKALKAKEVLATRIQEHERGLEQVQSHFGSDKVPPAEAKALLTDQRQAAILAGDVAAYQALTAPRTSEDTVRFNMRRLPLEQTPAVGVEAQGLNKTPDRPTGWGAKTVELPVHGKVDTEQAKMALAGEKILELSSDVLEEIDDTPLTQEELQQVSVNVRMSALDNERQNIRELVIPEDKQKDISYLRNLERRAREIMNNTKLVHGDNVPVADQKRINDTQQELFATLDRRMNIFSKLLNAVEYKEGHRQLDEAETDLRTTERRLYLARLGKLADITQGQVDRLKIDLFAAQLKYNDVLDFVSKLNPEQEEIAASTPDKVEISVRPTLSSNKKGMLGTAAIGIGLLGAKLAGLFGGGVQEVKKKPEPAAEVKIVELARAKTPSPVPERVETIVKEVAPPANLPIGTPDLRPRVNADTILQRIEETVPIGETVAEDTAPAPTKAPNFIIPSVARESGSPRQGDTKAETGTVAKTAEGKIVKVKPVAESEAKNFGVKSRRAEKAPVRSVEQPKAVDNALPSFDLVFGNVLKDTGIDLLPYLQRSERPPQRAIDALSHLNVEVLRALLTQADDAVKLERVQANPDMSKVGEKRTLVETLRAALKKSIKGEAPPKPAKERKVSAKKELKAEKVASPEVPLKGNLSKLKAPILEARRNFLNKEIFRLNDAIAQATFEAQQKGGALAMVNISESDRTALLEANAELGDITGELSRRVERPAPRMTLDDMRNAREDAKESMGIDSHEYRQADVAVEQFIKDNNLVKETTSFVNERPSLNDVDSMEQKFTDFDKIQKTRTDAKKRFGVDSDEYKQADAAYTKYMKDNGWRVDSTSTQ